jgi:hypothetical protein
MLNHLLYQAFKREKMTRKSKAAKNRPKQLVRIQELKPQLSHNLD